MTLLTKFGNKASANQQVIGDSFYSYQTLIAEKKGDKVYLTKYWNYSRTTLFYLKQFLGGVSKNDIEKGIKEGRFIL